MAKVTGPLLSVDARGKVADTIVFSYWRGQHYVRRWLKPNNPNTAAQQSQRASMAYAMDLWHNPLLASDRAGWADYQSGQPISGVNQFIREVVLAYNAEKSEMLPFDIEVVEGNDQLTITATTTSECKLKCQYGTKHRVYTAEVSETGADLTSHSIVLPTLAQGVEYFMRLSSTDPNNNFSPSGEYTGTPT